MANDTGNDNNQATDQNVGKVTFTDEQQARVNELLREAQGRAAKEVKTERDRLAEELRVLKETQTTTGNTSDKTGEPPKPGDIDYKKEVERIKKEYDNENKLTKAEAKAASDRAEAVERQLRTRDRFDAIREAMDGIGVEYVNRNDAVVLSEKHVVWDTERKRYVIHDESGNLRYNKSLEPLSLTEFYQGFVTERPYLIKAQVRGGAGSKESVTTGTEKYKLEDLFGPKSIGKLAQQVATKDIAEYRRLKAAAKDAGLI
jgi:hypothetical protein